MWEVETTDAFDEWWHTLTEQEQDDVTAVVELLLEERSAHLPIRIPQASKDRSSPTCGNFASSHMAIQ